MIKILAFTTFQEPNGPLSTRNLAYVMDNTHFFYPISFAAPVPTALPTANV